MLTLEATELTKRYGNLVALDRVSLTVHPGRVTALLGPNGAGKSTTLRLLLGLARPTSGTATIGGRRYADIEEPARIVGALLDSTGAHPGLTAAAHLRTVCLAMGLPASRAGELLHAVGLDDSADRRTGGFSLGMKQRLGLATALAGDPAVLVLDEPANGLDPAGIAWLRGMLRYLANSGRTVLVSSHVLTEVQQLADDVLILDRGRLTLASPLDQLRAGAGTVRVRTRSVDELIPALEGRGASVLRLAHDALQVTGLGAEEVGQTALDLRVVLTELVEEQADLESAFLRLTEGPHP